MWPEELYGGELEHTPFQSHLPFLPHPDSSFTEGQKETWVGPLCQFSKRVGQSDTVDSTYLHAVHLRRTAISTAPFVGSDIVYL